MNLNRLQQLAGILTEGHELSASDVIKIKKLVGELKKMVDELPEVQESWDFKTLDKYVDKVLAIQNKTHDITQITGS